MACKSNYLTAILVILHISQSSLAVAPATQQRLPGTERSVRERSAHRLTGAADTGQPATGWNTIVDEGMIGQIAAMLQILQVANVKQDQSGRCSRQGKGNNDNAA